MTEMLKMSTKKHKRSNPDKVFTGSYNCNCVYHSHPLFLSEPYCQNSNKDNKKDKNKWYGANHFPEAVPRRCSVKTCS